MINQSNRIQAQSLSRLLIALLAKSSLLIIALLISNQVRANQVGDSPANNNCNLTIISQKLANQHHFSQFKQEKTVAVLSQPLKSNGYLLLNDDQGIIWQTVNPIKSTTVINDDSLKQYNKNDQLISLPEGSNNAASQLISSTFLSILTGDLSNLKDNFEVQASCIEDDWTVQLIPNNADIELVLNQLTLKGSDNIQQLKFTENNQDITHIWFEPSDDDEHKKNLETYLVD